MTTWKLPPIIKLYEALGTLGDKRIHVTGPTAQVSSSSGTKTYTVSYDADEPAIMANDNASYWQGYLGYPALAYLLATDVLSYDHKLAQYLAGFDWHTINTRNRNDWAKSEAEVRAVMLERHGVDLAWFDAQLAIIMTDVAALNLAKLGPRKRPPAGTA